ncbi:MAG: tyrosine-type recombinase/integrase [Eubacterium sp.]|nr:tyrosine-type recombinase/integrase [Eubacterium sp.]
MIEDKTIRFHHLRHSCCSIMFKYGYSREDTQRWIGHADGSTVTDKVYNHYEHQMDISKLERFDGALRKKRNTI